MSTLEADPEVDGRGIAHSEQSPSRHEPRIHGVQLWVALPEHDRGAEPRFDHHALLPTAGLGAADVEGARIEPGTMLYVSPGREAVTMRAAAGSRLLLLGGLPFGEKILMWWNFVARTAEEIADAVDGWNQRRRFGDVDADDGERLAAPVPDVTKLRLR